MAASDTPDPTGPVDALGQAMANAPEAAQQALNRAMEQIQAMVQTMTQAMTQAFGDNAAMLAPEASEAVTHLPEVLP